MMKSHRDIPAFGNWMSAAAMLALALLAVAALLNGIGRVGVMASPDPGSGRYLPMEPLPIEEKVDFAHADRMLRRLPWDDADPGELLEAPEPLLMALASALEDASVSEEAALKRVRMLLNRSLPAPAARQVAAILPRFLRYQRAEAALFHYRPGEPQSIEGAYTRLLMQKALRRIALGPDVSRELFGMVHQLTEVHLARQMLMERQDLGDEEKRTMLQKQMKALTGSDPEGGAG